MSISVSQTHAGHTYGSLGLTMEPLAQWLSLPIRLRRTCFTDSVDINSPARIDLDGNPSWTRQYGCWESKGRVAERFFALHPDLEHRLRLDCPSTCREITISSCMIGKSVERAKPYIIIAGEHQRSRQHAKSAIEKSRLLVATYFKLLCLKIPPYGPTMQLGEEYLDVQGADNYKTPCEVYYDASSGLGRKALRLYINKGQGIWGQATANAVTDGATLGYLTTAHAFNSLYSHADVTHGECRAEDIDDDDDDLKPPSDSDTDSEGEHIGDQKANENQSHMPQHIMDPLGVRGSNAIMTVQIGQRQTTQENREDCRINRAPSTEKFEEDAHASTPGRHLDADALPKNLKLLASKMLLVPALDLALLRVEEGCVSQVTILHQQLDNLIIRKPRAADVDVYTAHGLVRGKLFQNPILTKVPGSTAYVNAFRFRYPEGEIRLGDSGSCVVDADSGEVFGVVITASMEAQVATLIPAASILRSLRIFGNWRLCDYAGKYNTSMSNASAYTQSLHPSNTALSLRRFFKRRNGTVNASLLIRVRKALADKCSKPYLSGLEFIHHDDAKSILHQELIKDLFKQLPWYNENRRTEVSKSMTLILCILIFSNTTDWVNFPTYFYHDSDMKKPRYTDKDLPIQDKDFFKNAPQVLRQQFLAQQYVFCPVIIKENSYVTYSANHRLPILRSEKLDVVGAQGDVKRVLIEKNYLENANQSRNFTVKVMACKRITARTTPGQHNFATDLKILEQFRNCIVTNENIMQSFASFIHGDNFLIFTPWAEGRDLDIFLRLPDKLEPYPENSWGYSPHNLLLEIYNLAQALEFLHNDIVTLEGKKLCYAHLDLKPENVLVYFPSGKGPSDLPVGRWMISDFGLSKVEEVFTETTVLPVKSQEQEAYKAPGDIKRELSFTPRQIPGAFQPPEVYSAETIKVSTRRDVWSFGCILAMVLAFALNGPAGVEEQTRKRALGTDDYFYDQSRITQPSRSSQELTMAPKNPTNAQLKPSFLTWLQDAPTKVSKRDRATHNNWIEASTSLIKALLTVDVLQRPEIKRATCDLGNIIRLTDQLAIDRLWDVAKEIELVSNTPIFEQASSDDASSAFFESHGSPPSSISAISLTGSRTESYMHSSAKSIGPRASLRLRRGDPSTQYLKIHSMADCQGTALDSTGNVAATWSKSQIDVHVLALDDDGLQWRDKTVFKGDGLRSGVGSSTTLILNQTSTCVTVLLAGQFVAVLSVDSNEYAVQLYQRGFSSAKCLVGRKITLREPPYFPRLSPRGMIALAFNDRFELHTDSGLSTRVGLNDKNLLELSFSEDGTYLCLWEQDTGFGGQQYWTIYKFIEQGTRTNMVVQDRTISCPVEPYSAQRATNAPVLIALHYPYFIASDKQQRVYLVDGQRAHLLCYTSHMKLGRMLPDKERFVWLRTPEHQSPRAEICSLSISDAPAIRTYPVTGLGFRQLAHEREAVAVRVFELCMEGGARVTCLLALLRSGWLVRKELKLEV